MIYKIKIEYLYEDFSKDKRIFHFSDYSAKPKYYDDSNKLVAGKIKDETAGVAIIEFVALKPYEKWPSRLAGISYDCAGIPPRRDENFPFEHTQVGQHAKVE